MEETEGEDDVEFTEARMVKLKGGREVGMAEEREAKEVRERPEDDDEDESESDGPEGVEFLKVSEGLRFETEVEDETEGENREGDEGGD